MTSRDFCYWLQGYFEVAAALPGRPGNPADHGSLTADQVDVVKRHLALVFVHEIDPQAGPPGHQETLNAVHHGKTRPPSSGTDVVARC